MIGTQDISISKFCDLNNRKSKEIIADENLLLVCPTNKNESEIVIVNEVDTEERESKSIHKSINTNKGKYVIDESDHEEHPVTDNQVINDPSYFNLFECSTNIFNRLYVMCKWACMATSRDRYYTEMFKTLTD